MVPRVQATVVEQDVRERGPDPRSADEDAAPLLGRAHPPQTAHRLLVVDRGGGGGTMTSIDRNGISITQCHPKSSTTSLFSLRAAALLTLLVAHTKASREVSGGAGSSDLFSA